MYRVEVWFKEGVFDAEAESVLRQIVSIGVESVHDVKIARVYNIEGDFNQNEIEDIAKNLLIDPVVETYFLGKQERKGEDVEITFNPGVMDPAEEPIKRGIRTLGYNSIKACRTSKRYIFTGESISKKDINKICEKVLMNKLIQHVVKGKEKILLDLPSFKFKKIIIPIRNLTDQELKQLSIKRGLSLDLNEMKIIKNYFIKEDRDPTDVELETIAQSWSEHCIHKTFKSEVEFEGKILPSMFSLIKDATNKLKVKKPYLVSVFDDNSGVISFNDDWCLCFKVETHNHPSALEPYGGAATGIGGVVRDIMGTGLSAKPIANTDVFCFGNIDVSQEELPKGTLHPKRILEGVFRGVRDYGNRIGVPTVNGAVLFHDDYLGNPLVFCGSVGIVPKKFALKGRQEPGDLILLVGGRTGRDGIHGVNFASVELSEESEVVSSGAVQIGDPFTEKKLIDTILKVRDMGYIKRITDCGGGGLSSAVGEMGEETGVEVYLDKVPLKYQGLNYFEIWISESQERMVLAIAEKDKDKVLKIFESEDVEATVIGKFTNDKRLKLYYENFEVSNISNDFLFNGWKEASEKILAQRPTLVSQTNDYNENITDFSEALHKILSSYNICSKEKFISGYDFEVQGMSVIKPLIGLYRDGPSDAAVLRPFWDDKRGFAISNGINPFYGLKDPYWMSASAIEEALRQLVCVGADITQAAILDNFAWGSPKKPENVWSLYESVKACHDFSLEFEVPFISGKDSLYNEFTYHERVISVPPTLLISAIAIVKDVEKTITSDFKGPGNMVYLLGKTYNELGGSQFMKVMFGSNDGNVPKVYAKDSMSLMKRLSKAIELGLVDSCHDLSDGGLAVCISEMSFSGNFGVRIQLKDVVCGESINKDEIILFSESNGRFLVEVKPENQEKFERVMEDSTYSIIGKTCEEPYLTIKGLSGETIVKENIYALKESWRSPLLPDYLKKKTPHSFSKKSFPIPNIVLNKKPKALVLKASGANCDSETVLALENSGAEVDSFHINRIIKKEVKFADYRILVLPGGFTYGDYISAGKIMAVEFSKIFNDVVKSNDKMLIVGICNGFQVLVKTGILPGLEEGNFKQNVTLTYNTSGEFQCEWVNIKVLDNRCIFVPKEFSEIELPIAHAEGRFYAKSDVLEKIFKNKQVVFAYDKYNPNDSKENIAGITDKSGRILGLMPHPERNFILTHHPYKINRNYGSLLFNKLVSVANEI
ncbi:Phosphoribosylformylglycinamidine synthase 2 [Thermodesulfobium narugense DSM 14796]|uniref:Phosphoribosylformylglycinamidine synthase subunit PurL n=1 Tax=Thermodesulfobium narugense DSM 14796 TaxID=747365 RepID=M1E569_9BACT|nr:phosphoribosylformylglycinamidine synthase subunit PurL [Thermodesulfobium narugense]AEE14852.1 Phosphoribosylformylglycinamidine synthase 2 [Thermodesulfobium narugense DSM 14796]